MTISIAHSLKNGSFSYSMKACNVSLDTFFISGIFQIDWLLMQLLRNCLSWFELLTKQFDAWLNKLIAGKNRVPLFCLLVLARNCTFVVPYSSWLDATVFFFIVINMYNHVVRFLVNEFQWVIYEFGLIERCIDELSEATHRKKFQSFLFPFPIIRNQFLDVWCIGCMNLIVL